MRRELLTLGVGATMIASLMGSRALAGVPGGRSPDGKPATPAASKRPAAAPAPGHDASPKVKDRVKGQAKGQAKVLAAPSDQDATLPRDEREPAPGFKPCGVGPSDMACVPGGSFTRGVDHDKYRKCFQFNRVKTGYSDAEPAATLEVSTFYMDIHEVTVADFKACKKAGVCNKHAGPHYKGMDDPKMPILAVTWYDAKQFCEWRGKRLATEAEWEKAARGPNGDIYPWGNDVVTCEHAIIREHRKTSCGRRKPIDKPTTGRPFAWGSRPAGHYGLFDMVGNAEEWVADWYSLNWRRCGKDCLGRDPKGPCGGADKCPGHKYKVVRGGSWFWPKCANTGYHRRPHVPRNRPLHHFGFRCAASLEQAHALATKEGKAQPPAAKPAAPAAKPAAPAAKPAAPAAKPAAPAAKPAAPAAKPAAPAAKPAAPAGK